MESNPCLTSFPIRRSTLLVLNIITQIADNNGFKPNLADKTMNKNCYKQAINFVYPTQKYPTF